MEIGEEQKREEDWQNKEEGKHCSLEKQEMYKQPINEIARNN